MDNAEIIGNFKSLCGLTAQMRELVAQGKWDELVAIEQRLNRLVEHMKSDDGKTELDEASRRMVVGLIKKSMEDDAAIRAQTRDRMSELQNLMQSDRQRQRLNKTYS